MLSDLAFPLLVMGFLVLLVLVLVSITLYLKRRPWTAKKKKAIFSLAAAFLIFPVWVPAGTIAALPAPNIVFLALAIFTGSFLEVPVWYFKTLTFCIVSYFVTVAVLSLVAQIIFFERRQV